MGAFETAGLGDPGEKGEWISLSNRCKPPLGRPSMLNVGRLGVGSGSPALLGFRPVREKLVLSGVPMDASEPSGLDTERFRCFRLSEDLFFLIPKVGGFPVLGEPGTRPASLETLCVAGDEVGPASAGLYSVGCGDGAARPVCRGSAGSLNVVSSEGLLAPKGVADLGWTGRSVGTSLAGTGGFSVCGAGATCATDVSILSDFAFCPDNLRLRTEAASLLAVVGRGVTSVVVSVVCDGCDSRTGGNAGRAPDGAGTGGGECAGGDLDGGCITSVTVESEVPPVVLCDDTELLYVLPEMLLESDCRGSADFVCR
jgi:hypothetical protein